MRKVLIGAVLLALTPGPVTAQSSDGSRARAGKCEDCSRDSTGRVMHKRVDRLDRLVTLTHELFRVRQMLEGDRELSSGERRSLEQRARRLQSQVASLERRFRLEGARTGLMEIGPAVGLEARRAMAAAMAEAGGVAVAALPSEKTRLPGWIGITLDAPSTVEERGGDVYWRFFEYPRIISVDPSSPAERAGVRQGDVLLAYDGQDVRREIAMNRLLQPGRMVRVRLRGARDNEVRDVPVKVAPVRHGIAMREWAPEVPPPPGKLKTRRPRVGVLVPVPPGQPNIVVDGHAATAPALWTVRVNGLAGAHMETITPGLGEAIGVGQGVLVLAVAPGVPAHESGLIDGDVIVKADGREVRTVNDLRTAMAAADDRAVRLDVARKGKVRQVTLRW